MKLHPLIKAAAIGAGVYFLARNVKPPGTTSPKFKKGDMIIAILGEQTYRIDAVGQDYYDLSFMDSQGNTIYTRLSQALVDAEFKLL